MNEKYYYFAKLSEIRNIATRGLFCQWDEKRKYVPTKILCWG